MSHHHRKLFEEKEPLETNPIETSPVEKPVFPLLEKNDIEMLTMMKPLFTSNGQKIFDILIAMGSGESQSAIPDLSGILNQFMSSGENNKIKEMLPFLISMLSNPEIKNIMNPALITAVMSMFANRKETVENEST